MFKYEILCDSKQQLEFVTASVQQITKDFKVHEGQVTSRDWLASVHFELEQQYSLSSFRGHCIGFWVHRKDPKMVEELVLIENYRADGMPELEGI